MSSFYSNSLFIVTILDYFIFHEEIFFNNHFYSMLFFNMSWFNILLPELFLILFILYNLINFLNCTVQPIFQFYRWIFFLYIILFILIYKLFIYKNIGLSIIILGFSWINCWYTLISKIIIVLLVLITLWISIKKVKTLIRLDTIIEFPLILGFSLLFMFFLTSSYDFLCVYLSIEGLSLTLYILAAIIFKSIISIEATLKYFSLGAVSTGFLLLGVSILFSLVGSLDFLSIQLFLSNFKSYFHFLEIKLGFLLIFLSFFFKISAFPCHIWIADVYEGVWTPITFFFAVVVKVCLILFFSRLIFNILFNIIFCFQFLFSFIAIGSMLLGAFSALKQIRVKRFIAYASINQVGFLLLGVSSCNLIGLISIFLYLITYVIMNILFFSIILNSEHIITQRNIIYLSDLYAFSQYNSESTKYLVLTIMSMAGLPPFGGFIGKLFLYFSIIEARLDCILILTLIISVVSVYYYLSLVRHILFEKQNNLKLYYYIKNITTNILLRVLSIILVFYFIFLLFFYSDIVVFALSCVWPLILKDIV